MSVWVTTDNRQVYMNVSGDVFVEHLNFLEQNMLKHLQYGYRRIVVNINNIGHLDHDGIQVFQYVREKMLKHGGELIIEDEKGKLAI
ncbi:STAS domain-containing protein [Pelosinus fermentans]|uniref:Sulfate transporter/antisigma-factor antagonist STAS n=1 Tax=Pelosinus fermentans JBW45 TaxID=1192197 RepID=I9DHL2_9FIRM|nr:STAS domain-containing protein [Pelosinus fermentans]AJQ28786.1 Sulfate transporter/antisigma-factor antagonist STAS [Pelosinus fermentans JBW45]